MRANWFLAALSVILFAVAPAAADPIAIVRYDVLNALVSGSGGWSHTYTGSITPTMVSGSFSSFANYTGGGGTLNDGVVGTTVFESQLFEVPANSSITLYLAQALPLTSVSLFGGDIRDNSIPGSLRGTVTVTVNGVTADVAAIPFGRIRSAVGTPVNDHLVFRGTPLHGLVSDRITLSGFRSESLTLPVGSYSLAEVTVNQSAPIPEPASIVMFATGAAVVARRRWSRRKR